MNGHNCLSALCNIDELVFSEEYDRAIIGLLNLAVDLHEHQDADLNVSGLTNSECELLEETLEQMGRIVEERQRRERRVVQ